MNKDLGTFANQVIESSESTNDLARELGDAGFPHGTWVSSRLQTCGRGRLDRSWESVEGGLFLSVLVRIEPKFLWSWIPLLAAVSAIEVLRELYPKLDLKVKWPNDLWIDHDKAGGILCEATLNSSNSFIVVGLGVNCTSAPEGLDQKTSSLSKALGRQVTADDIRLPVIQQFLALIEELKSDGVSSVRSRYERWAVLKAGTEIEWSSGTGTASKTGTVSGLGDLGELWVDSGGDKQRLLAEDVRVRSGN